MAKCPKCGAEVDRLINSVQETHFYELTVEGGSPEYEEFDSSSGGPDDYRCPKCDEVLFYEEGKAIAFLMG